MATNIEIEAKCLISKEDYNKVIKFFNAGKYDKAKQTNYYIDTDDLKLKKMGIGLRIRSKQDFVINLKAPMAEGLLEKNEKISWLDYEDFKDNGVFPPSSIEDFIKMLGLDPRDMRIQTSLVTDRIEIPNFQDKGLFSIDKNDYNGITDYELELEGNSLDKAKAGLKEICEQVGIKYVDNLKSKQSRALETIKRG